MAAAAAPADKVGLPPMVPHAEVLRQQQQQDLKEFRKYLIQSGAVRNLVKLYQHALKHEMRMDNPNLVSDFMNRYRDTTDPSVEERELLAAENAQLREENVAKAQEIAQLEQKLMIAKQSKVAKALWDGFTAQGFWEKLDVDAAELQAGLTGAQLYTRLCGNQQDAKTSRVLAELVRPAGLSPEHMPQPIALDAFAAWLAQEAPSDVLAWCEEELLPKLEENMEPPFEKHLLASVRDSELYPADIDEVAKTVTLEPGLRDFFDSLVQSFAGNGGAA